MKGSNFSPTEAPCELRVRQSWRSDFPRGASNVPFGFGNGAPQRIIRGEKGGHELGGRDGQLVGPVAPSNLPVRSNNAVAPLLLHVLENGTSALSDLRSNRPEGAVISRRRSA